MARHSLKSSATSRTEHLLVTKNKFLKNTFIQDRKNSLVVSAASNFLNHKERFKVTTKIQPRLGYQQGESTSQDKGNQYTTQLSRLDALPDFNKTLMLFQLAARKYLRNPISYNAKSNEIFKRAEKQVDKSKSKIFKTQIGPWL